MEDDFFSLSLMMKAHPHEEGGRRVIYCEASNETVDAQNEVVLQKALAESMEYMLAKGNFDLDHITMTGPKLGIADYMLYEIGRPTEINFRDGRTFVKGFVYSGSGPAAERANYFWSSLTDLNPPAQWFPSVGGAVLGRDVHLDPATGNKSVKVNKVRWSNVGYSKQPVNQAVPCVQAIPMGTFAKSITADSIIFKALEAGTATDVTALTGGGALGKQSLDRKIHSYWDFRESLAGALRKGRVKPRPNALVRFATSLGLDPDSASDYVERFLHETHQRRTL
jgi:hypothetical protein